MNRVVVVGSGGREHALAWRLSRSAHVVVTPGSDGMSAAGIGCTSTSPVDLDADLFLIGPEVPLVAGLADTLRGQGKAVFGPGASGARLEGSKAFMKELCDAANVPTARWGCFTDVDHAIAMLRAMRPPFVVKTDGLAAGKGVLVTDDLAEAERDVRDKLSGRAFGAAGATVVIEEGLPGDECSLFVLCDGARAVALPPAQDFKRVGDGGTGPNTGGMGAYAPYRGTDALTEVAMERIVEPTLRELRRRGIDYRGVLYAGLMVTEDGPTLLEYNVRFGDPETQAVMPLLSGDLDEVLLAAARGQMEVGPGVYDESAVTVVLASEGYPASPRSGDVIAGLGPDGQLEGFGTDVTVFHAGTARNADGQFVTAGGRVVCVTATAPTTARARERAYEAASAITFPGRIMRTDIAASLRAPV